MKKAPSIATGRRVGSSILSLQPIIRQRSAGRRVGGNRFLSKRFPVGMVLAIISFISFTLNWSVLHHHLETGPEAEEGKAIKAHTKSNDIGNQSRGPHFWDHEPSCFHLDYICHANNGKWFYDPSRTGSHFSQPAVTFNPVAIDDDDDVHLNNNGDIHFNVQKSLSWGRRTYFRLAACVCKFKAMWLERNHTHADDGITSQCYSYYSQTPYHIVIHSDHNDMLGEFYIRSLIGLNQWTRKFPPKTNDDFQFYIHFHNNGGRLFDGHKLFLGGLPQNGKVENFKSLVQGNSSQCFQKLVFCGYNLVDKEGLDNKEAFEFTTAPLIGHPNPEATLNLYLGGRSKQNPSYQALRQDLLTRNAEKNPMLQRKVREYRLQTLLQKGLKLDTIGDVDEWKIIGLSDRKYRRVWLNIETSITTCDSFLHKKVICIKVNVEEAESVEEQLLMHMSLNGGLIGIHGSQLTNAVLLPKHSFILELLPWIPSFAWGAGWAATTNQPTPMGTVFHDTDLNHVGFSLDRSSVPFCHEYRTNEEQEKNCFGNLDEKFRWDVRDFNVEESVVMKFISSFVLVNNSTGAECDSMEARTRDNGFVLYNAFCSRGDEFHTEHFYKRG